MEKDNTKEKTPLKKQIIRISIGLAIGALLGYAYYYFIGCNSGSCPLTSNPLNSIIFGMFAGGALAVK
jgi:hypothetical protein